MPRGAAIDSAGVGTGKVRPVPFERSARAALRELQGALDELVSRAAGNSRRAVDLQRALGLDKKLGWQLFRFVRASDPLGEAANVPSEGAMRRLAGAAAKRGVARAVIERAERSLERYEAFVAEHGGDRAELVSLIHGISAEDDPQREARLRREMFKGLAHLWGVRAAMTVRTFAIHLQPGPERVLDSTVVSGTLGVQRLRHGVPLTFRLSTHSDPAAGDAGADRERARTLPGMQWVAEFTTRPPPELVTRTTEEGYSLTEVGFPPSGRAGAVTLYTKQSDFGGARGEQANYTLNHTLSIPTEALVMELLVPEGLSDPETARAEVYGRRDDPARAYDRRPLDLLPQRETATHLGTLEDPPMIPGAPHHAEAVRHVLGGLGWLGTRYDVYRCVVAYPLMHTMVGLTVDGLRER